MITRRGRAQQRNGRGSSRREFRRTAGDLPQHPRRDDAARRRETLLRVAVHRPGHRVPGASRFRHTQVALSVGVQKMVRPISPARA